MKIMGHLIFVTGGSGSGKTGFALDKVSLHPRLYIATGRVADYEMYNKIMNHKLERVGWDVLVSPIPDVSELEDVMGLKDYKAVLLDCVGFFLTNLMMEGKNFLYVVDFVSFLKERLPLSVVVSNEVGMAPVPPYPLGREFVHKLGRLNRLIADLADEFYLIISGQALKLK